jgi:DNA-binding CsgD family transcriptional regulator
VPRTIAMLPIGIRVCRMTDFELAWLAGLLEGKGSFMAGPPSSPGLPIVSLHMTDGDVVIKVSDLMGLKRTRVSKRENRGRKDSYVLRFAGAQAVALMKQLRPLMSKRRKSQIDAALSSYVIKPQGSPPKLTKADLDEIRRLRSLGLSFRKIAAQFNITHSNVYRALRRAQDY